MCVCSGRRRSAPLASSACVEDVQLNSADRGDLQTVKHITAAFPFL